MTFSSFKICTHFNLLGDAVLKMNWNVNNKTNLLLWYRTCAHNLCVPYSIFYVVLSHVQCRRKWCLKLFWCVCSGQSPRTCCTAIWLVLIPQSVERQGFRAFDLAEGISDARGLVFQSTTFDYAYAPGITCNGCCKYERMDEWKTFAVIQLREFICDH